MKKITILLAFVFAGYLLAAQHSTIHKERRFTGMSFSKQKSPIFYTFSIQTGTFTFLSDSVSLNQGEIWDDPEYFIPLPFPFIINGSSVINELYFDGLGGDLAATIYIDSIYEYILPFSFDLIDRGYALGISVSELSYFVDGVSGSRVLKVEWKNVGSYDEGMPYNMFVNFQLWLYEGSNIIEVHIGPSMINNPSSFYMDNEDGAYIGIASWDEMMYDIFYPQFLNGPVSAPTLTSILAPVTGTPSSGTIYRFTPITQSIDFNPSDNKLIVSPNPSADIIKIGNVEGQGIFRMTDQTGKTVLLKNMENLTDPVDIHHLSQGMFFITVQTSERIYSTKLIIQ